MLNMTYETILVFYNAITGIAHSFVSLLEAIKFKKIICLEL